MADNSLQGGSDSIRDIDRSGAGPKTQVFQVDHGGTGASESLTSRTNPFPVGNQAVGSGTLSATDAVVAAPVGDGTLVSGASTAGSVVAAVVPNGMIAWTLLIKGYVSGTIYTEASTNSTNGTDGDWVEVKGRRTGTAPGTESVVYAMVSNGYYRGNCAGFTYIRARLIGGTGPTIAWTLSSGVGAMFLNSGIPGGSSNIGLVTVANASLPVTGSFYQSSQPVFDAASFDLFASILTELRVISTMLQIGLSVKDEPSDLREDQARQLN